MMGGYSFGASRAATMLLGTARAALSGWTDLAVFSASLAFVVALAPGFGTSSSCLTLCDLSLVKVSGVWTDQERRRSAWLFGTASIPELTFDNLEQQIAMAPGQKARALRARLLAPPPAAPPTAPGQDDDDDDDDDGYVWV